MTREATRRSPRESPRDHQPVRRQDSEERDIITVKDPLTDLPHPGYDVGEEQPPYANGHQDRQTFTKLFVHNLDFTITKEGILRTFAVYGRIKNINFPYDARNRPRGLAFVIFERHADA
jgi:RNA recognition motif-containing protein